MDTTGGGEVMNLRFLIFDGEERWFTHGQGEFCIKNALQKGQNLPMLGVFPLFSGSPKVSFRKRTSRSLFEQPMVN
jgi:hypothetical protein